MAEREVWNEDTGQYEFANAGETDTPYTPPAEPWAGSDMSAEQIAAYNAGNPPPEGKRWTWDRYNWVLVDAPTTMLPAPLPNTTTGSTDPYADYNGNSPPAAPLNADHGWEWNGSRWIQVQGRGIGWSPRPTTPGPDRGAPRPTTSAPGAPSASSGYSGGSIAGVPTAWSGKSVVAGPVPTLASSIESAKQLKAAPAINPYADFERPQEVGKAERDRLIQSILGNPMTMDQTQQDRLFEQQKEQQRALGQEANQRMSQATAGRGFSSQGGQQQAGNAKLEQGFIQNLMSARRDVTFKAAEVNRQNELAAVEMSNAVNAGDFSRAQAAYETQLNAKKAYDELRFRAAEFDRSNVALAAQTDMASRQQQNTENMASFQQYMDQLKFDEMMRQFNEQTALNYSKFGWDQQMDFANMFPR